MVYGCASSHFTLITIRPIDELFMSIRAMRSGATCSAGRAKKAWGRCWEGVVAMGLDWRGNKNELLRFKVKA